MGNMYGDSVKQWNVMKGCKFDCTYCKKSFQLIAKRWQKPRIDKDGKKQGCQQCYDYEPHFHPERLNISFPKTEGDQFIWCCSSGDISFMKEEWMEQVLDIVRKRHDRRFFFQTKDPRVFLKYDFPNNSILGITLENNRDYKYDLISKAPLPHKRWSDFRKIDHPKKRITVEPILEFDIDNFFMMLYESNPEKIYIGYDTKKTLGLIEPTIEKTRLLISYLRDEGIKVQEKYIPGV